MLLGFTKKKVKTRQSLGRILRSTRQTKSITLEQVEINTKVNFKYLQALEKNQYNDLPPDIYTIGFLKRYSHYLGLETNKILELYRKEKAIDESIKKNNSKEKSSDKVKFSPVGTKNYEQEKSIYLTPQLITRVFFILLVIGLVTYIGFQVKSFATAPALELKNPQEQIVVGKDLILLEGKTDKGATLIVNNESITTDLEGGFRQEIKLVKGLNNIEIVAKNKANKETKKVIKVLAEY